LEIRRNRKLSLKEILENIDPSDIKTFVHQYAKNDKAFEVIIKAHFISRFVSDNQDLKYNRILSELIRPKTLAYPKLTGTAKKSTLIILEDFTYQMADLLSIGDYKEAFYILKNALDKIAYLQNSYGIKDKTLDKQRISFLDGLAIILKQDLAPEFRAKMEEQLRSLTKRSYYYPSAYNLISLLDEHNMLTISDKKELIDDLIQKNEEDSKAITMTLVQLAVPVATLANKVLQQIKHKLIFKSLSELIHKRKFDLAEFFLENEAVKYDLHKPILHCMLLNQKGEYKLLTSKLTALNSENTPILILKDLIDYLSPSYLRREYQHLSQWLSELPFSLRSKLYAKAEDYDTLADTLKAQKEIEWVKVYDKLLIEKGERLKVKEIYLHCAEHYLQNHMGSKAVEYISLINHRLTAISEKDILREIQEKLFDKFSHRSAVQ